MLTEAVAGFLDLDDDGVVEQPIEKCRGNDGVTEYVAIIAAMIRLR